MLSMHDFKQPVQGAYCQLEDLLSLRFAARELQLTPRQQSRSLLSGGFRTRFRGRGMEFEEVRHYQAGDDIRSIDWRVTARTSVPHTKLFREERERPVILMLDQRNPMFFGSKHCFKAALAAHTAALMGWAALANNDRVGALIFNDTQEKDVRPKRSRHTLLAILKTIQEFNTSLQSPVPDPAAVSLSQRLRDLRRIAKPGSAIIISSDFHDIDQACDEQLYQLSRHGDVSLLHICDVLESHLPANMQLTVSDGQQRRVLDTRSRSLRAHYQQQFDNQFAHLQSLARQLAVPLLTIRTDQPPLARLLPTFGKQVCRR